MPSAPPSSEPVSAIADALPAPSGGTEATMISVVSAYTGARPTEKTNRAGDDHGQPVAPGDPGQHRESDAHDDQAGADGAVR